MRKEEATGIVSRKMKLVRIEAGLTQDKMADTLGISKKTLVQIEKERVQPSWTTIVAVCALFRQSELLQMEFGGDPLEVIETIAHSYVEYEKKKTMGGKVWWREIEKQGSLRLQQNMISQHYRILDEYDYRLFSTFDKEEAMRKLVQFHEQL